MQTIAPTYLAAAATLLVGILSLWGKVIPFDTALSVVTAVALIAGPLFVMFRQWYTNKSTLLGARPK